MSLAIEAGVVEPEDVEAVSADAPGVERRFVAPGYQAQLDRLAGNLVVRFSQSEAYDPGYHSGDIAAWPGDVLGAD